MTDVVEQADVGVLQVGDGGGFALEAFTRFLIPGQMRGEQLKSDEPLQAHVAALVDFAHAPRAKLREDFIGA